MKIRKVLISTSILFLISFSSAQTNRNELLSRDVLEKIGGEISGKACFENIRDLGVFNRYYGSDDQLKSAEFVAKKAKQYGLTDVRVEKFLVDKDTYYGMQKPHFAWNCASGELRMLKPFRRLITTTEAISTCVLAYSRDTDIEAEVVSVGRGTEEEDYAGKDVRGKIVLAYGSPGEVSKIAIFQKGAAGILAGRGIGGLAGAVSQTRIKPWSEDGSKLSTFGFSLSDEQTRLLEEVLSKGEKLVVQARIKAEVRVPGYHYGVTATLPGTSLPGQEIILTAHLDHPRPGAHDDNSGCGVLLETARALKSLTGDGSLERPKRTIRFYWTPHIWGAEMLFATYPELLKKTVADINVDCVGIDQTKVSSAFSVIMPPFSRASFLGDIFANFLNYVAICNNSQWTRVPYGSELKDQDGTGNVFYGRIIPYMGFSDHEFFNSGTVGIPGVMLIDLPFIAHHSQKDELNLLDPTQLKRISFLVSAAAYTISAAGPSESAGIVDEIYHRGRMRLETEMKLAKTLLREATKENATETFGTVDNLLAVGTSREIMAIESAKLFSGDDNEAGAYLAKTATRMKAFGAECRHDIEEDYRRICRIGGFTQVTNRLTEEEKTLQTIVPMPNPKLIGALGLVNEYPIDKYTVPNLGSLVNFSYELMNFMDGKRNMLDVLQIVRAEALSSNFKAFPAGEILKFVEALKAADVISY